MKSMICNSFGEVQTTVQILQCAIRVSPAARCTVANMVVALLRMVLVAKMDFTAVLMGLDAHLQGSAIPLNRITL